MEKAIMKAKEVLEKFFFIKVDNIKKLSGASPSQCWLVSTDSKQYVLRKCVRGGDKDWLFKQEEIIQQLFERNVPIQNLIKANNHLKTVCYKNEFWQLRNYTQGSNFDPNKSQDSFEAIKVLRKFHTYNDIYLAPNEWSNGVKDWLENPQKCIEEIKCLMGNSLKINDYKNFFYSASKTLNIEEYLMLPHTLTHGDYHGNNLIYEDSKIMAIIDLDTMGTRPRILDLAYSIFLMKRTDKSTFKHDSFETKKCFELYDSMTKLSVKEVECIIPILQIHFLPNPKYLKLLISEVPELVDWYINWSYKALKSVSKELEPVVISLLASNDFKKIN